MKPFKTRLGWTRGRERPLLFGPDAQIELRPWITGSRVGLVLAIGLAALVYSIGPEGRIFVLGSLALGVVFGLILWLRHR